MRSVRINPVLLAAALAFSLASPLCADQVVYFINGKAIMVKSVEKGDKFTVLEMDGGGKMGVPTDQIARVEEYVLSAPGAPPAAPAAPQAAPQTAPAPVPAAVTVPGTAQPIISSDGRINGMPANQPVAAPTVPGPGMGGRPAEVPGNKGMAGLQPLSLSGGAVPPLGIQRPAASANAGPTMGGSAAAVRGNLNNPAGRRFAGRPGMQGRGRPPEVNRYLPQATAAPGQNQPPAQGQQPAHPQASPPNPPPPAEADPPAATEPEPESPPPADPENETSEPETPPPGQGEAPDDSGGAS